LRLKITRYKKGNDESYDANKRPSFIPEEEEKKSEGIFSAYRLHGVQIREMVDRKMSN
jgi:hypothetical protein